MYSKMYPASKSNEIKNVVKEIKNSLVDAEPKQILSKIEYETLLNTKIDNLTVKMKEYKIVEILNTEITFGKYKGDRFICLPSSYLNWLVSKELVKDKCITIAIKMVNKLEELNKQLNYSLSKDF